MRNLLLALVLIGAISAGIYYGIQWKNKVEAEKLKDKAEQVIPVTRKIVEESILLAGDITPYVQVDVKPEVSSKIKKIYVELGGKVKADDMLVELDDSDLQTDKASAEKEISSASLNLERAKRTYGMNEKLWAKKLISEQTHADSKTDLEIAKNNFEKAQKTLQSVEDKISKTKIRSPMSGTVLSLPVVEGQVVVAAASVNSGTLLMSIADLSNLIISAHVNQVDVAKIKPKNSVTFKVDAIGSDVLMKGYVDLIAPLATVKNNVKGFDLQIKISDGNGGIRPGMTADVTIPVGKVENALTIPLAAVFKDSDDMTMVYLKTGLGTFEKRYVKVGISNIDLVEIQSGLKDGDWVSLVRPVSTTK